MHSSIENTGAMSSRISVTIICKNEEKRIEQCLKSVAWADEIVLVDSGSTDRTLEIAKKYTDKIFINTDWQGFGAQKNWQLIMPVMTGCWLWTRMRW